MLLHDHPVNVARGTKGEAPANAVWFSESGAMPAGAGDATIRTFADGGIAQALAARGPHPAEPVPADLAAAISRAGGARSIIVALDFRPDLATVERAWAAPAWNALASGHLDAVTLAADGAEGAVAWTARRPNVARRLALRFARPDLSTLLEAAR